MFVKEQLSVKEILLIFGSNKWFNTSVAEVRETLVEYLPILKKLALKLGNVSFH